MVSSLIDRRKICVGEVVLCFNALKFGARPGPIPASTYPHSYVGSIAVWGQKSDLLSVLLPLGSSDLDPGPGHVKIHSEAP